MRLTCLVALLFALPALADGPVIIVQSPPTPPPVVLVPQQMPRTVTTVTTTYTVPAQIVWVQAAPKRGLLARLHAAKQALLGCN